MQMVTKAITSIGLAALTVACGACKDSSGPGEFPTSHSAKVSGFVVNAQQLPQDSIGVSGRELRADAGYHFDVVFSDKTGQFVLQIDRIDALDRPEPDTLSVMLSLRAVGSKYPRAADGSQLRDSIPVVVRFAKVGQAIPVTSVQATFRGL